MHRRLGNATLAAGFPRESNQNFPFQKFQWDNTVVKILLTIIIIINFCPLGSFNFISYNTFQTKKEQSVAHSESIRSLMLWLSMIDRDHSVDG